MLICNKTQWIFCGIDTQIQESLLVAVENRKAATLLPILQQYVLSGTTVISDLWKRNITVSNMRYKHLTFNHQLHFVEPVTYATPNHVKWTWSTAKQRNKVNLKLMAHFCRPI